MGLINEFVVFRPLRLNQKC